MISVAWANRILASLEVTVQLHTGEPGPLGALMVADGLGTRQVKFTVPVDGQVFNTDTIAWVGAPRMARYTHFTAWDNDGLLFIGTVIGEVVFAGDNIVVDPGHATAFFDRVAAPTPS